MTIHTKIIAVQSGLVAPKSKTNSFAKYKYRSCEDILEAVKPLLKEQGLLLTIEDDIQLIGSRFYVKATACVSDGTDVVRCSAFAREPEEKKGSDASQITGAASSYARKYALNGIFIIDDTEDADSMDNSPKPVGKAELPKPVLPATKEQLATIEQLLADTKSDRSKFYAYFKVTEPNAEVASDMIDALNKKLSIQIDQS